MEHLSDIEIAQQCKMQPIVDIARAAGVDEKYLERQLQGKGQLQPA